MEEVYEASKFVYEDDASLAESSIQMNRRKSQNIA